MIVSSKLSAKQPFKSKFMILKRNLFRLVLGISATTFLFSCVNDQSAKTYQNTLDIPVNQEMIAELTAPPHVPIPVGNRKAKKLIVDMEILELEGEMVSGVKYMYWTFGGSVPGSFIRARVGDEIEFHLKNHPDNKLPHNIDLHAVNGPGGGAESSFVAPGHEKVFSFKVLNPGLYVYHCATAPVGMHIANGMYGLILIEPEGGLAPVDKEYYVMQGDFYTDGKFGDRGMQGFNMQKAIDEKPDYVVFNGSVNSMTGDNALTAEVGETVRLFVGNGGPNLVSSFHVIGEIFDRVHEGGADLVNTNVQTTLIPSGGAAIVEFKVDVPGTYVLVDHSIFRAFNKGALAMLEVTGEENKKIFSGEIYDGIYLPEGSVIQSMPGGKKGEKEEIKAVSFNEKMEFGKDVYNRTCVACHQDTGKGIANAFPPLANSDYLNADVNRAIDVVLHGLSGEISVNGEKYNSVMTSQALTDEQTANVLTYVYNSWGNSKKDVTAAMVEAVRNRE